jgi:hypothetical protein
VRVINRNVYRILRKLKGKPKIEGKKWEEEKMKK